MCVALHVTRVCWCTRACCIACSAAHIVAATGAPTSSADEVCVDHVMLTIISCGIPGLAFDAPSHAMQAALRQQLAAAQDELAQLRASQQPRDVGV